MGGLEGSYWKAPIRALKKEKQLLLKPPLVWGGLEGLYWKAPTGH